MKAFLSPPCAFCLPRVTDHKHLVRTDNSAPALNEGLQHFYNHQCRISKQKYKHVYILLK